MRVMPIQQKEKQIETNRNACPLCKSMSCSVSCKNYDWEYNRIRTGRPENNLSYESSDATTLKQMRRTPDEFEIVHQGGGGNLGKGSYGAVKLVRDRCNGLLYAMKIMVKKEIFEYCSVENLKREIRIQKKLEHPHVTKLFHYFEDKECVYLILEYAQNGSLYSHLRRCKLFAENEAFVYFFQTCLGIDYLHKKHIIHRDLKPENLLLDDQGNIKICDFGWSAENNSAISKRTTFCGTIDYMAPEMIENRPHDHTLDIWCLGILLYELLHGKAPFKGRNDIEKCNNIVKNQPIEFEFNISQDAKELILLLLKQVPQERISMVKVFNHPWMIRIAKSYGIDINQYIYVEASWRQQLSQSSGNGPNLIKGVKMSPQLPDKEGHFSAASTNTKNSSQNQGQSLYQSQVNIHFNQQVPKSMYSSISSPNAQYEEKLHRARVSKRSQRNLNENSSQSQQGQPGVIDRFLMQLGCMKRD